MARTKGTKAKAPETGAATTDDEIEEEATAAGDRARENPLSHPNLGEVERAALAEEDAVRTAYRR